MRNRPCATWCACGARTALDSYCAHRHNFLRALARRAQLADAEDALQEAMLRLLAARRGRGRPKRFECAHLFMRCRALLAWQQRQARRNREVLESFARYAARA